MCAREDGIRGSKDLRAEIGKFPNSTNERKQMSTKTIKQRIALVAVSALTAGLFSVMSAPVANAAVTGLTVITTDGTTAACKNGSPTAAATPRYMPVGGKQAFTIAGTPSATASMSITGPAKFAALDPAGTHIIDGSDAKSLDLANDANHWALVEFTGTGTVTVTADDDTDYSLYFIVQASCAAGWSASTSYAQLNTSSTSVTSNVDVAAAATVNYTSAGQVSYLNIDLNDAYGNDAAAASSALIATTTGGCTVNFTESASSGTVTAISTVAGADTDSMIIFGDNTPRTCVITLTLDGTEVAKKTVNFRGDLASLTVNPATTVKYFTYGAAGSSSETVVNANAITYIAKDSAGNVINLPSAPSISDGTGGFQQVSLADSGLYTAATATSNGFATLDVNAASVTVRGKGTYVLKATRQSDGVSVKSAVQSAEINKTSYTFEVAFDKASYQIGDVGTVTITAKDDAGNLVADGDTVGSGVSVVIGGVDMLSTPASGDKYTNGVRTYKFTAKVVPASFGWSVGVTTGSSQSAVTGTIKIVDPVGSVSNAEVLKSIVALIASINKQIQALQKLILKR